MKYRIFFHIIRSMIAAFYATETHSRRQLMKNQGNDAELDPSDMKIAQKRYEKYCVPEDFPAAADRYFIC